MALRNMRFIGDEILRKNTRTVEKFDERLWELLDDMKETLVSQNGAGLAAPQVGILKKVAIVSFDDVHIELVNPEITHEEGAVSDMEGCLSIPNKTGYVTRPSKVRVHAQNRNGEWFDVEAEGFVARALCHEIDHLSGVLYSDKVTAWVDNDELERMREKAKKRHNREPQRVSFVKPESEE
ncbi:MAG: peptide deformylase [Clostridia bacterium]|nr:peptide deformylase [Clostridia bacterium]